MYRVHGTRYWYRVPGTGYRESKLEFRPGDLPHKVYLAAQDMAPRPAKTSYHDPHRAPWDFCRRMAISRDLQEFITICIHSTQSHH